MPCLIYTVDSEYRKVYAVRIIPYDFGFSCFDVASGAVRSLGVMLGGEFRDCWKYWWPTSILQKKIGRKRGIVRKGDIASYMGLLKLCGGEEL